MIKKLLIVASICLPGLQGFGQSAAIPRFGKITAEDFKKKIYSIDSNANAIVIADVGSTGIEGNPKGGYSLVFKNYRRAHILNKNGYDLGDVQVALFTDGKAEEEIYSLKAVTYNLENGKVIETRLDPRTSVFKDKVNKNKVIKRFTLPNVKAGSIIEYEYTLKSDFLFNLQPWEFQGEYPRLWSEYTVSIPEFYYYVTLWQGYQPFFIKEQSDRADFFTHTEENGTTGATERTNFKANVTDYHWVMKDVPALREENFTSTLSNHIARIEFQLAEVRPPFVPKNIMGTWTDASEELLKDENFGYSLTKDNPWLNDIMNDAGHGAKGDIAKAENIYAYVRDNFTCTNHSSRLLDQPLRNVLKSRTGNVAEINLLLVAMLRKADLAAAPVMLSTRSHGYTYEMYPLLDRFNYVIAQLVIGEHIYYLDASEPGMGFGRLDYECYNGHARVINEEATPVEFNPDSLVEKSVTSVFIIYNEKGDPEGNIQRSPGYYESHQIRERIKEKGKEQLAGDFQKGLTVGVDVNNILIDSLDKYDDPVSIRFDFDLKQEKGDLIYLDPMFGEGIKENPFKSAERYYPVEMPYTIDQTYLLQMEIPPGYMVDELPEQAIVKMNANNDGVFEYRINEANGTLSLRSRLRIKRSYFMPEEYKTLREFFNLVVKKHHEQVVLKKKS